MLLIKNWKDDLFMARLEEVNPLLIEGYEEEQRIVESEYDKDWQKIIAARQNGTILQAKLTGLEQKRTSADPKAEPVPCGIIQIGDIYGYIPISHLGLPKENLKEARLLAGKKIVFKVLEYKEEVDKNGNGYKERFFVASRKLAKEEMAKHTINRIKKGDTITAVVRSIEPSHAVVEIGGIDVNIPVSELAHGWIDDIHDIIEVNQQLKVKVIDIDEKAQRVELSAKALQVDPWESVPKRFKIGAEYTGKVSGIRDYGVFINLGLGVDSLARHLKFQNVNKGDEVLVRILNINTDERRINAKIIHVY